jgi:hypothetical protein
VGIALIVDADAGATDDDIVGVAAPASPFFDVYIDFYNTDPNAANDIDFSDDGGNPGADPSAAGVATLPAGVVSISMGELNALDANSESQPMDLAIIDLGAAGDICISVDTFRGGIVNIQGGTEVLSNPGCFAITDGVVECFPACHPDYAEWLSVGSPTSWCGQFKQCHGDADGADEAFGRGNFVAVGSLDVSSLLVGFNDNTYVDPATDPWIAADFDHAAEAFGRGNFVRVGSLDVGILLANFNVATASVPADCLDCP